MCPNITIDDNVTAKINEVALEVTIHGYTIVGEIDKIDNNFDRLIDYLDNKIHSDNAIKIIQVQDNNHIQTEQCNGIFNGVTYDYDRDDAIGFKIEIRIVPELRNS